MSVKKKKTVKKESPISNVQSSFHTAGEIASARKKLEKLKKLGEEIDPVLANAAKRACRPYKCLYPATNKISIYVPNYIYTFIKEKSKKEDSTMREIIIDAIMEQYDEELFGKED